MEKNESKKEKSRAVELRTVRLTELSFAGCVRRISGKEKERPAMQQRMWDELEADGTLAAVSGYSSGAIEGMVAICCNFDRKGYDQFIGVTTEAKPEEYKKFTLPAGDYAVFERAPEQTVEELWRSIYFELLPKSDYIHTGGAELEVRNGGDVRIYIPVKPKPPLKDAKARPNALGPILWMCVGLFIGLLLGSGKENQTIYIVLGLVIGGAVGFGLDKTRRDRLIAKEKETEALVEAERGDNVDFEGGEAEEPHAALEEAERPERSGE